MGTKTWSGDGLGTWSDPKAWKEGSVPDSNDDIVIPASSFQCTTVPEFTAGKLTIEGSGFGSIMGGGPVTVTDEFSWTGGWLSAELILQSSGTIRPGELGPQGAPSSHFAGILTNQGSLAISGAGTIAWVNGATLVNEGSLVCDGNVVLFHEAGGPPGINSKAGSISFAGGQTGADPCLTLSGGYLLAQAGHLTVNAAVAFQNGGELQLNGATIQGSGRIVIGDWGVLSCATKTEFPATVTLEESGRAAVINGGALSSKDKHLVLNGALILGGTGHLEGLIELKSGVHLSAEPKTSNNSVTGCLLISGSVHIDSDSVLAFSEGGELLILGSLEIHSTLHCLNATITCVGTLVLTKPESLLNLELTVLAISDTNSKRTPERPWPFDPTRTHRGACAIADGQISVLSSQIHVDGGTLHVVRKDGTATPGVKAQDIHCQVAVGPAGILRVVDAISVIVTCDGRLEISSSGSTAVVVTGDLTMLQTGRLEIVDLGAWQRTAPLLNVSGRFDLAGAVGVGAVAAEPQTIELATAGQVVLRTLLTRIDTPPTQDVIINPPSETALSIAATKALSSIGGEMFGWPTRYPEDAALPGSPLTSADFGAWMLQQIYENTSLAFLGFYLAPTHHGRNDASWMTRRSLLAAQGWGLVPIYFGTASDVDDNLGFNATPQELTAAQANADANQAVTLAKKAGFPTKSRIYFDLESPAPGTNPKSSFAQRVAYAALWVDAVNNADFEGALYANLVPAKLMRKSRPAAPIWISNPRPPVENWFVNGGLVPASISTASLSPSPAIWQYLLDVRTVQAWEVLTTDGKTLLPIVGHYQQTAKGPVWKGRSFDFDLAESADPGSPDDVPAKAYAQVTGVSAADEAPWTTGVRKITITLSRPAPPPLGQTVYITSDVVAAQPPTTVVVPSDKSSFAVEVDVHTLEGNVSGNIFAWTPRQTRASASQLKVSIDA
ncbi:glycoside hydrolase domain-containing protein [Cellulomonas sp. McL0617]|uniref:glycoside hydrolase domain-containing protein n=1 Tax=Cellulomonas sp. McL0617 TaxID=3415675 RepID=UPI003CF606C1